MQVQATTAGYSIKEEIAHSVTHGIGMLMSVIGLATLIVYSSKYGDAWHIVSSGIYGFTLIALYTTSTLYHSVTIPDLKKVLQRLDHAAIFLLIAGTYTPFTLINLRGGDSDLHVGANVIHQLRIESSRAAESVPFRGGVIERQFPAATNCQQSPHCFIPCRPRIVVSVAASFNRALLGRSWGQN